MTFEEQRANPRIDAKLELVVIVEGQDVVCETLNLSLGGAKIRLALDPPPAIGAQLDIRFAIPELAEPIRAQAQVRWVDPGAVCVVGLQFSMGFRAKETWALSRFLEAKQGT